MTDDSPESAPAIEQRAVIDRIEDGGWAVLLFGDKGEWEIDFPVALLPPGARGGDHLRLNIAIDPQARKDMEDDTRAWQERMERLSGTQGKKDFKL